MATSWDPSAVRFSVRPTHLLYFPYIKSGIGSNLTAESAQSYFTEKCTESQLAAFTRREQSEKSQLSGDGKAVNFSHTEPSKSRGCLFCSDTGGFC